MTSTRLILILLLVLMLFSSACGEGTTREPPVIEPSATESSPTDSPARTVADSSTEDAVAAGTPTGMGRGVGRTSGMMERHRATIPTEYAGLTNPIEADEESLARGAEAYSSCAVCHGDTGLGDGPAGVTLDPAAANIAHTSQMMGDDYFFWRISEGGGQFGTLMPAWEATLDEQTRWDLINYIQSLGTGTVGPGGGSGQGSNAQTQAARQAAQQAALLATAIEAGLITQDEADGFAAAHEPVDARMAELRGTNTGQGVDELLTEVLAELVASGELTHEQADTFLSVHDRLSEAGLLP